MDGLMMDYQLNVPALLRRADELYGENEIASRLPDKSWHRYTYADFVSRTKRLVVGLRKLGLEDGDRVGTFMWNHSQHLETYMGSPVGGFVTHTLNLRLHPDDNTYIATHGGDRVLIVDKILWPLAEQFVPRCDFEHVIAVGDGETPDGAIDYEDLIADADESAFSYRDIPESGRGRDVLHERHHRAPEGRPLLPPRDRDPRADGDRVPRDARRRRLPPGRPDVPRERVVLPLRVHDDGRQAGVPRPPPGSRELLEDFQEQKVTVTAGVPTIWMGILQTLDANPGVYDTSSIRFMTVGGAAPPRAMIEAFSERHGLHIVHGWGMTEMSPVGTLSGAPGQETGLSPQEAYTRRALQGLPLPFVEIRASGAEGSCRGTARRWASSRCAARRSRPRTTSPTRALTAGPRTAGSGPATSSRSTRTGSSRCRTARRTW